MALYRLNVKFTNVRLLKSNCGNVSHENASHGIGQGLYLGENDFVLAEPVMFFRHLRLSEYKIGRM